MFRSPIKGRVASFAPLLVLAYSDGEEHPPTRPFFTQMPVFNYTRRLFCFAVLHEWSTRSAGGPSAARLDCNASTRPTVRGCGSSSSCTRTVCAHQSGRPRPADRPAGRPAARPSVRPPGRPPAGLRRRSRPRKRRSRVDRRDSPWSAPQDVRTVLATWSNRD